MHREFICARVPLARPPPCKTATHAKLAQLCNTGAVEELEVAAWGGPQASTSRYKHNSCQLNYVSPQEAVCWWLCTQPYLHMSRAFSSRQPRRPLMPHILVIFCGFVWHWLDAIRKLMDLVIAGCSIILPPCFFFFFPSLSRPSPYHWPWPLTCHFLHLFCWKWKELWRSWSYESTWFASPCPVTGLSSVGDTFWGHLSLLDILDE